MKPHEEWLFKAENDIKSAEFLLTSVDPLYDIAIYLLNSELKNL